MCDEIIEDLRRAIIYVYKIPIISHFHVVRDVNYIINLIKNDIDNNMGEILCKLTSLFVDFPEIFFNILKKVITYNMYTNNVKNLTYNGYSPLAIICQVDYVRCYSYWTEGEFPEMFYEIICLLVSKGADVNFIIMKDMSLLHFLCMGLHKSHNSFEWRYKSIICLINNGANINVILDNKSPLDFLRESSSYDVDVLKAELVIYSENIKINPKSAIKKI